MTSETDFKSLAGLMDSCQTTGSTASGTQGLSSAKGITRFGPEGEK